MFIYRGGYSEVPRINKSRITAGKSDALNGSR